MAEMSDEELLGYAELHCKTERALFHRDHVVRIYGMAGLEVKSSALPEFVAVHEDAMEPLVAAARRRTKFKLLPGGLDGR